MYDLKTCVQWDESWFECADSGPNSCTSCKAGCYLELSDNSYNLGTCQLKSSNETTLSLFVTNQLEIDDSDGSYSKPFGHLVKALNYANSVSALYAKAYVNIYLLSGDHYMSRNESAYYFNGKNKDQYSGNQEILIQPAFWDVDYDGVTLNYSDGNWITSDKQITVYYQLGNSFYFTVPKSLQVLNIIFDALDSSIYYKNQCLRTG